MLPVFFFEFQRSTQWNYTRLFTNVMECKTLFNE